MENILIENNKAKTTFIIFGGLAGGPGILVFEFKNITEGMFVNRIFIKDPYACWYCLGLDNEPTNQQNTVFTLSIELHDYLCNTDCILIGNSSGAFMALLFADFLEFNGVPAKKLLAFSPQCFIDKMNRDQYGDKRWSDKIQRAQNAQPVIDDLSIMLERMNTNIDVHYSKLDKLDTAHVSLMQQANPSINFISYEIANHDNLVKHLRNTHELKKLLEKEL